MVYDKLKSIRYKNNMTTKQVADAVGISKAFYCQLENRKRRLSYETAVKIAGVFGLKPDNLFYEDSVSEVDDNVNIKNIDINQHS